MFAIAAINDTDSRCEWEPLAPAKEAQEFHLSQTYHDGLTKLQSKDYDQARLLFESVLKDPIMSSPQADNNSSDGHLLQLRFLTLKNLATVFLEQGSAHYESALKCYLQAVELDEKDSVVWNQLGTLSCMMGLLSISRWAFEQGLNCSPNNWNCMEKLLEVLIAIKDETACLSVAELMLKHWPSHSRALHVRQTISDPERILFAPRGVDKLQPQHVRLKFPDKRKLDDECREETQSGKRLCHSYEIQLREISWMSLVDAILKIDSSAHAIGSGISLSGGNRDISLCITMPSNSAYISDSLETTVGISQTSPGNVCSKWSPKVREKEGSSTAEEPLQERRSIRLESLRNRKPGKDGVDGTHSKDSTKIILQTLEPFLVNISSNDPTFTNSNCLIFGPDCTAVGHEEGDVAKFVSGLSKNYGACHVAHLILEEAARRCISYQEYFAKFKELDQLARFWGQDRTTNCSLFLAELYYDASCLSDDELKRADLFSESLYNLCKVIELVALDASADTTMWNSNNNVDVTVEMLNLNAQPESIVNSKIVHSAAESQFWIRFFWLSGRLSVYSGDKEKAYKEFNVALSFLEDCGSGEDNQRVVPLPHCKLVRCLSSDRLKYEISLLIIESCMKKTINQMIECNQYMEIVKYLSPLLVCNNSVYLDLLLHACKEGEGVALVELSALDVLISACEQIKPLEIEILLNSHRRKLQLLAAAAGMVDCPASQKSIWKKVMLKLQGSSEVDVLDNRYIYWGHMVAEELKAMSASLSLMKSYIDQNVSSIDLEFPVKSVSDIQSLLLLIMCWNVRKCQRTSSSSSLGDQNEQLGGQLFIDAAIIFCKLQHLNPSCPINSQVELIVAVHDLLAEFGICYAGKDSKGEEGSFLKIAIKHLLALDMRLKSNQDSSRGQQEKHHAADARSLNVIDSDQILINNEEFDDGSTQENLSKEISFVPDSLEIEEDENDESKENKNCQESESDEEVECGIESALDQCFYCLYGLNLRSDSCCEDDLVNHKNTSLGDYQTMEQCSDVFQYILPYAKVSSKSGLVKLRKILKAIHSHFPQPPEDALRENQIDKFLDDPAICEDELSDIAAKEGNLEFTFDKYFPVDKGLNISETMASTSCDQYLEIYRNLYYFLALAEEMNATDKRPGFVLTKEGEDFIEQHANLLKYDLMYNPLRFDSWKRLATIYDEEVDLLLNDGSKHINVLEWRKHHSLPGRVEVSRRRARRCSLMSCAVATTPDQKSQMNELLALVYYDSLQNVVPFYDQRTVVAKKNDAWMSLCENSIKHFKRAFDYKPDWLYAFYLGKLCEKMRCPPEKALSYYQTAVNLNPSAVDTFYRMHASRMKFLYKGGKQNIDNLQAVAVHSYSQSTKDTVLKIFGLGDELSLGLTTNKSAEISNDIKTKEYEASQLEEAWNILFSDCLTALKICVEGELKHFHKARYKIAQGLYRRRQIGDIELAKDQLSFCFKSSRSSFTINMWEIDGMTRKGRRKTPGNSGNKRLLEVSLSESSRKFITCIRKYVLLYLSLLEKTRDVCTLDRAYTSLRSDRRFSLCLEDIVPVSLGRYLQAIVLSIQHEERIGSGEANREQLLDRMFNLSMDHGNLWTDVTNLPELKKHNFSEITIYSYIHEYIQHLEKNVRLDTLEVIHEKIRRRFKNPKLSNPNAARICKHASVAWCRTMLISLALITPVGLDMCSGGNSIMPSGSLEFGGTLLYIDLDIIDLWSSSSFDDIANTEGIKTKWFNVLSPVRNIQIKQVSEDHMETATVLLKSAYSFHRDNSIGNLLSGLNMYTVAYRASTEGSFPAQGTEGVEVLDVNISRKLLLWAYTLVFGRYSNILSVIKYCEETAKLSKMKKGVAALPSVSPTSLSICNQTGPSVSPTSLSICNQAGLPVSPTSLSICNQTVGVAGKDKVNEGDYVNTVDNQSSTQIHKLEENTSRSTLVDLPVEPQKTVPPLQQCSTGSHSIKSNQDG